MVGEKERTPKVLFGVFGALAVVGWRPKSDFSGLGGTQFRL